MRLGFRSTSARGRWQGEREIAWPHTGLGGGSGYPTDEAVKLALKALTVNTWASGRGPYLGLAPIPRRSPELALERHYVWVRGETCAKKRWSKQGQFTSDAK